MRPTKIVHVDYGTRGTAGLYLAQVLKAYSGPIPVDAYVHSEFPPVNAHGRVVRLFDRFSRLIPSGRVQQLLKCLDLYLCFAWLIFVLRRAARKHQLFVFVQFFQSFHAYRWLFSRISPYCTLVVTVHDAVELQHNYPALIMSPRDEILKHAHFLLVHGAESVEKLRYLAKPMMQIPFPLMVSDMDGKSSQPGAAEPVNFLFIGHIRPEKGIDTLIDAWKKLPSDILEQASLTIAGTYDQALNLDFSGLRKCALIFEYLDDKRFVELIRDCHYVVMPYRGGTNSGVLSIAAAQGRPCITTQIPVFSRSPFYDEQLSFSCDLSGFLSEIISNHAGRYDSYLKRNELRCANFQSKFSAHVNKIYADLIN